jgi:hypothetical protein
MWAGMGTMAAAAAANGGLIASTLGNIGTGIFAAGNFIGGTLGAMGAAVSEGGSQLLAGNITGASEAFMSNMTAALSGEAGMTAVNAAAAQAAQAAGTQIGSLTAEEAIAGGVGPLEAADGTVFQSKPLQLDASVIDAQNLNLSDAADFTNLGQDAATELAGGPIKSLEAITQEELYGKAGELTLAEHGTYLDFGAEGVKAIQPGATSATSAIDEELGDKVESYAKKKLESYLSGSSSTTASASTPYRALNLKSTNPKSSNVGGQGSSGFSLLSGVRGLENSVRNSQSLMFT